MKYITFFAFLFTTGPLPAQHTTYYMKYDDSSLKQNDAISIMPFNRLVKSAGRVVSFGNPALENHALDLTILPGGRNIAVEHRYGVAILDVNTRKIKHQWSFEDNSAYRDLMSTYSGIKSFAYGGHIYIVWSACSRSDHKSAVMIAEWKESGIFNVTDVPIYAVPPANSALPNELAVHFEKGAPFLYVVLNGNNQLLKINFLDRHVIWSTSTGVAPYGLCIVNKRAYVTNWAGPIVTDSSLEYSGTPWGSAYTDPKTGGTARGSLSIIDVESGNLVNELPLGLHPNAIKSSPDRRYLYICNGSSDYITVIDIRKGKITDSINVGLFSSRTKYYGSSPNAVQTDATGKTLYVANGLDNAICVVKLGVNACLNGTGMSGVSGFIPTEAYPGGVVLLNNTLYIANIEAKGSSVLSGVKELYEDNSSSLPINAYTIHQELASVSVIPVPTGVLLKQYTGKLMKQDLAFRIALTNLLPRQNILPRPVPERIGEPSVFKHVVYIIKENKTYDQVYGDLPEGRGMPKLCIYGDSVTPNMHKLTSVFSLMDNYYASGKSSAEGHQWADAAMVSDYIEKNVRAWFRSYPHRQEDALVYNKSGFIWNNALDHGKKVRIYGEACLTHYDKTLKWLDIYKAYLDHKDQGFTNSTTIARIRPIISPVYPDCDNFIFTDQLRADIFINDWKECERQAGDILPDLMVVSLPNDHTAGTSPDFPTPRAMVADNDLATGRIVDAITHSRFWDSTVVFITEDDSQSGWDHISPYRTVGLVISPYSALGKTIHTNYNQTSMVRTIEQILGIPPLNIIDATALPMFDCFTNTRSSFRYTFVPNRIPLNSMNKSFSQLKGKASYYARLSAEKAFKAVDEGEDDLMNRILWFDAMGDTKYPATPR